MTDSKSSSTEEDNIFEELAKGYFQQNKELFKDGVEPDMHSMAANFKLNREFLGESDRASVIIAAIMLENALTKLLKEKLIPSPKKSDPLFDGANAPLGTFSAKINLAFRLGLIPSTFFTGIEIIRKIRNDFAHNISEARFESPSVKHRITALITSQGTVASHQELLKLLPAGIRGEFLMTVSWMLWCLTSIKVSPLTPPEVLSPHGYFFPE